MKRPDRRVVRILILCGIGGLVLLSLFTFIILRLFFFDLHRAASTGMFPILDYGELFLTRRSPYNGIEEVRRGDIVIIDYRGNLAPGDLVSRVVGLPGDRITLAGQTVTINSEKLRLRIVTTGNNQPVYAETNGNARYSVSYPKNCNMQSLSVVVPDGCVYVLGDNRCNALDSRTIGPVTFSDIKGLKLGK